MSSRTLLVDADIVAYKFSSAHEQVFYFDGKDAPPCVEADLPGALAATDEYLEALATKLRASEIVVCLTDPAYNFRTGIDPTYKGNRKGLRKPEHLTAVKEHFTGHYRTYQRPGLEADDCMGILATHPSLIKGERVMVSEDKDMQTIPGVLFNPAKDKKPRNISRLQADLFHLWQTVVGDRSDGYPGAYGIGESSAEARAILASRSVTEAWGHVLAAYNRSFAKLHIDASPEVVQGAAIRQARLARILRATDWDFTAKRPRLWVPPKVS